tara:strand:- start:258 stop:479 length:222 start_codon:yes stop_codon:yes gene_type:complete
MIPLDELDKLLSDVSKKLDMLEQRSFNGGDNDDKKFFGLLSQVYHPESSKINYNLDGGSGASGDNENGVNIPI